MWKISKFQNHQNFDKNGKQFFHNFDFVFVRVRRDVENSEPVSQGRREEGIVVHGKQKEYFGDVVGKLRYEIVFEFHVLGGVGNMEKCRLDFVSSYGFPKFVNFVKEISSILTQFISVCQLYKRHIVYFKKIYNFNSSSF